MANKIALLIGNSGYRDETLGTLAAPEDDVIALKTTLEADHCRFETISMIGAGLVETQTAIETLFKNRLRDDTLLIYYTGHGVRNDRGKLYLALPQTDMGKISSTSLDTGFIREHMIHSASDRQIMILDCCHSGAVMKEGLVRRRADVDDLVKTDFVDPDGYGKFVLTACSAGESAFERDGTSIFTRHLVDGLRDGAAAADKQTISMRDVYDYLARRVPKDQAMMMPMLWTSEQMRDLVIASNPKPRLVVPDELVKLLWDQDPHRAYGAAARLIAMMGAADDQFAVDIAATLRQRLDQSDTLFHVVAEPIVAALEPDLTVELEAEIAELTERAERAEAGRRAFEKTLSAVRERSKAEVETACADAVAEARAEMETQLDQAQVAHTEAQQDWETDRSRLLAKVEDLRDAIPDRRARLRKILGNLLLGGAVVFMAFGFYHVGQTDRRDRTIATLNGKLETAAGKQSEASTQIARLQTEVARKEAEERNLRRTIGKIVDLLKASQAETEALEARVRELTKKIERLEAEKIALATTLDVDAMAELQRHLTKLGFYDGKADGVARAKTLAAVRAFRSDAGLDEDGPLDQPLLEAVERAAFLKDPQPGDSLPLDCPACPQMVHIPGGTLVMGSPPEEEGRDPDEGPQREVTIAPFALAATEVTFAHWQACVDDGGCTSNKAPDDAGWGRDDRPVINVSWEDAQEYIAWLNRQVTGSDPYRLPSEAEWEYSARAGTVTPFFFGETISTDQANYNGTYVYGAGKAGEYRGRTVEVSEMEVAVNSWGLRHMHGNVWEWVQDCWHNTYSGAPTDGSARLFSQQGDCARRVARGGSWNYNPQYLRSANRSGYEPEGRVGFIGFRPARTLVTP